MSNLYEYNAACRAMKDRRDLYSLADVIKTLKTCRGTDWRMGDALAFVSDLTGISIDSIWELTKTEIINTSC